MENKAKKRGKQKEEVERKGKQTSRDKETWMDAMKCVGGEETERFGDKLRMTKTEQTRESLCVCVCVRERETEGECVLCFVHHCLRMS